MAAEAPAPPPTPQVKETVRAEGAVPPAAAAAAEEKPKRMPALQMPFYSANSNESDSKSLNLFSGVQNEASVRSQTRQSRR